MIRSLILLILLMPVRLNAQQDTLNRLDSNGRKTGYWLYYGNTGIKQYEGYFLEGHPVGNFKRYHPNGKISALMEYDSAGIRVNAGLYDTEGVLRALGVYVHQRREGIWEYSSSSGKPLFRITFSNGLINGDAWRYDSGGKPMEKTVWKNSVLDGIQITFYPEGPVQSEISYRNGQADGLFEVLYPDGKKEISGQYAEGVKNGKWTYYKPDGTIDYELSFRKGKLLNPEIMDQKQRKSFENYDKNRGLLKDPQEFLDDPSRLIGR